MTLKKFNQLYNHYKTYYDFERSNKTFKEIETEAMASEEWFQEGDKKWLDHLVEK